jgi:ubiquinone/menaquinone biosynthesis C-methylase UbiE
MAKRFDSDAVREAWDLAADPYARAQATGKDHYRYEFFGPAQIAMCGDVQGLRVLDAGCGAGYFSRAMAERGATVTAFDISSRMIEHAQALGGEITYEVLDAMEVQRRYAAESFDLVTSCLALQDMPDPARVLVGLRAVLKPGGRLIASIEHPCSAMPFRKWERDSAGNKRWLCVDRYFERGPISYEWKRWGSEFTTSALHVPLEDWIQWIVQAGFTLRGMREPRPSKEAVRARPDLDDARRVPYFVIFDLTR